MPLKIGGYDQLATVWELYNPGHRRTIPQSWLRQVRFCDMLATMEAMLKDRIAEIIAAGQGEAIGEAAFVPLLALDSGRRCGLDAELRWVITTAPGAEPERLETCQAGGERVLLELLERKRSDREGQLAAVAEERDLPVGPLLLSVPAQELVRAALATGSTYYARLGLEWLLPSELRGLREEIQQAAGNRQLPVALRELAAHLVVPER